MRIQVMRGASYYFLGFVLLLFTVLETGVECKCGKEEQESLLAYLIDSGVFNQEMNLEEETLGFSNKLRNVGSSGAKTHNTIDVLHPHVHQILIDCLGEKNQLEDSDTWYTRFYGFLFNRQSISTRRALAQTPIQAPAPSPTLLPPGQAPAPSPTLPSPGQASAPSPTHLPPGEAPAPSPTLPSPGQAPAPSPTITSPSLAPSFIPVASPKNTARTPSLPVSPQDSNDFNMQPTDGEHTSIGISDVKSGDRKTNKRTVVIAVIVTACVTFGMAALLFVFWRRCCGPGWRRGRNDESPLLSLSLSDYSISSSHRPSGLEASVNEQKLGNTSNLSFNHKSNPPKTSGKFFVESHSLICSKIEVPVGTATPVLAESSLDPPPGTPSLTPLPERTQPPKPPVPPPPPTTKHSSSAKPAPPRGAPPPPPPIPNSAMAGGRPPPPRPGAPRPPPIGLKPPRPVNSGPRTSASTEEETGTSNKAKLKPFFWDKVLANPDHSMVWHQIKSGSFQFSEEMIESLFGYAPAASAGKNKNEVNESSSSQNVPPQYIQLIDAKKSQNLAILLKALNVTTEEVCDALKEGNELPSELIQTLLKMAPTAEEELKLRLYGGELSQLGPAERFLKLLVDIPFAFKRLESLLFMCTLQEETSTLKESFAVLEAACTELRKSRLFLKLLEAVLKTGNRMNDGTFRGGAQAFKLDTLLKLADVKGTDGKTTLLHFVVQEIIRSEGIRAARAAKETSRTSSFKSDDPLVDSRQNSDEHLRNLGLEVVSGLGNELENVKKTTAIEADNLTGTVSKLRRALVKARDFLNSDMKNVHEENGFHPTLRSFVQNAEVDIKWSLEEEKRIMALVKSTADYFHGNSGKDEGLRLFAIVRDFLIILDKVCREVKNAPRKFRTIKKEDTATAPSDARKTAPPDPQQWLFSAITEANGQFEFG
ncbi:hypothetical protein OROGR_000269 [Orobanche gracilis]